jgi:predicted aldo/keto reductase-like oxidoreductase
MQKVRLGKSQMEVSKIGFGGIPIQRLDEQQAVKVIQKAIELGIDWIDTANGYGPSEEMIGKAIKSYDRGGIKVFTKGGARTRKELQSQIELSFERMQTEYIDLFQFHAVHSEEVWEEMLSDGCLELLLELKKQGRIRHIGASFHSLETALAVMDNPEIEVIQWPFNFIMADRGREILKKCRAKDIGFIAMKPFGGGMLEDAGLCIRFLLQFTDVAPDPGFEKIEEIEEVVDFADRVEPLSEEDKTQIERLRRELGTRFCRQCGYCMPCPQGINIMILMAMESIIKRMSPESVIGWLGEHVKTAEKCTECGQCELKCPYILPIRQRIREGIKLFHALEQ